MKLSYHTKIFGKPETRKEIVDGKEKRFLYYNNQKVNLGWNWEELEDTWDNVFEAITTTGIATSAVLNSDHRTENTFVSRELVMVDIDEDFTLYDLLEDDFYNKYGAGFYVSPSHTEEHHKFRIMFRLESPITDKETMKQLHIAFLQIYPYADSACKDATRIFFGTKDCLIKEKTNIKICDSDVNAILSIVPKKKVSTPTPYQPKASATAIEKHLDELKKHNAELGYELRRDITWAVRTELSEQETLQAMQCRWPDEKYNGKYTGFLKNFKAGQISIGTVLHYIRKKNPDYCMSKSAVELSQNNLKNLYKKKRNTL